MDIHDIPFEESSFDICFCNHVMEHVNDDIKAMSEIYRVLRPGGWAIIQVPFFPPLPEVTEEDKEVTDPKEREIRYGQSDHVRKYGHDYPERLRKAGFLVDENRFVMNLSEERVQRHALPPEEIIYVCKKV
jgi:ubiquinone/menaquinone biosynthesis C-methylase UbiE